MPNFVCVIHFILGDENRKPIPHEKTKAINSIVVFSFLKRNAKKKKEGKFKH